MGPSPERACSVDMVLTTSITSQRDSFLIWHTDKNRITLEPLKIILKRKPFLCFYWLFRSNLIRKKFDNASHLFKVLEHHPGLTSSSGTPNLRSSCLAFFSESLLRSASVPVTVFFTGCGSLSSCKITRNKLVSITCHISNAEAAEFDFRHSDLLLSGLVGHFHIGETFSTPCRISHTCNL